MVIGATKMPVIIGSKAKADIRGIRAYLVQYESLQRAKKHIASIRVCIKSIPDGPYRFPMDLEHPSPNPNYRRAIVHGTYHVTYRIENETIYIVRVFHSAQNPATRFDEDD